MMHGHAQHGHGREALHLWDAMKRHGVMMVGDGANIFESMVHEHGMMPCTEHDVCVIDMCGGAGMLDKVKRFMDGMPVEPCVSI
ncbi:hypothetical protein AMTRI_Chr05g61650 [Amborella trichopoda]